MPLFTKTLFSYGSNPISSSFYRMSLSLALIFILAKFVFKYDMAINKKEFISLLLASIGFMFTGLTLFASYKYINSGAATSIHFTYPILIFVATIAIIKEKPSKVELFCILSCIVGLVLISDFRQMSNLKGVLYSLISAFTYAFYSIFLEHSKILKNMIPFKILFYVNALGAIMLFSYANIFENGIYADFTPMQWPVVILYSIILTIGATFLYQRAVVKIGAKYTSILSTLEPITSIIIGFSILHEDLSYIQMFAVILIFGGSFVLIKHQNSQK